MCRVQIDLQKIQSNLLQFEGGLLREEDLRNWLLCIGFHPEADGVTWQATEDCLSCLDATEFLRV